MSAETDFQNGFICGMATRGLTRTQMTTTNAFLYSSDVTIDLKEPSFSAEIRAEVIRLGSPRWYLCYDGANWGLKSYSLFGESQNYSFTIV